MGGRLWLRISRSFAFVSFGFLLAGTLGCQSAPIHRFDGVRVGMSKSMVVETAGSPSVTRRVQGKDRWIYEFHDRSDGTETREVQFDHGRAVYVGPKLQTPISADQQDRLNEAAVADDEKRLSEEEERRDKSLGIARPSKSLKREPEDALDRKLRESMYGLDADPQVEKQKRVPVFVPVD